MSDLLHTCYRTGTYSQNTSITDYLLPNGNIGEGLVKLNGDDK